MNGEMFSLLSSERSSLVMWGMWRWVVEWMGFFSEGGVGFYNFGKVSGMWKVLFGFPGIFGWQIIFPLDEVKITSSLSFMSVYCFYFILWFSIDKVWWWVEVIGSVDIVFFERGEKCGMEHGVDLLLFWEFQFVCEGSEYLRDTEGSFLLSYRSFRFFDSNHTRLFFWNGLNLWVVYSIIFCLANSWAAIVLSVGFGFVLQLLVCLCWGMQWDWLWDHFPWWDRMGTLFGWCTTSGCRKIPWSE